MDWQRQMWRRRTLSEADVTMKGSSSLSKWLYLLIGLTVILTVFLTGKVLDKLGHPVGFTKEYS